MKAPMLLTLCVVAIATACLVGTSGVLDPRDVLAPGLEQTIVLALRLPRVLVCALVGAALALGGMTLQAAFRNPLADPSVLGVSSGASLGAVVAIALTPRVPIPIPLAAVAGATLVNLVLARAAGSRGPNSLVVLGAALSSLLSALTALVLALSLPSFLVSQRVVAWLLGDLEARTWWHVGFGGGPIALAAVVVLLEARSLDALQLGELDAHALGVDVPAVRRRLVLAVGVLVGASVAIAGSIAFVGLLVPHLARRWVGALHERLAVTCIGLGAVVCVLCDACSRLLSAHVDLPLGVLTSLLGAPMLAILVRRHDEAQ